MKLGVKQQRKREVMAEKGSSELKTRLKSLILPHSGDWLNVVMSRATTRFTALQEDVMEMYRKLNPKWLGSIHSVKFNTLSL